MPSWNKGKTGLEAGWTPERRLKQSIHQKQWCKANPNSNFFKYDKTSRWKTGPDPVVRKHYYRFLRMRCQARYWCQDWSISWEDYLALLNNSTGEWGRTKQSVNLIRRDTLKGWHMDNVELMERSVAMKRPRPMDSEGKPIRRRKRNASRDKIDKTIP